MQHLHRLDSHAGGILAMLVAGVALFAYWIIVGPTGEASPTQNQWPYVLWFSATILAFGVAVLAFTTLAGGRWVVRLGRVAAAGALWNSAVNVIEDGFDQDWAFLLFVAGSAVMLLSLISLSVVLALTCRGSNRALGLVPLGAALGLLLFVKAGGIIMLATWTSAAAVAARWSA